MTVDEYKTHSEKVAAARIEFQKEWQNREIGTDFFKGMDADLLKMHEALAWHTFRRVRGLLLK